MITVPKAVDRCPMCQNATHGIYGVRVLKKDKTILRYHTCAFCFSAWKTVQPLEDKLSKK